jgi:hypothetical protein
VTTTVSAATATPRFRPRVRFAVPASVIRLVIAGVCVGLSFAIIGWQPIIAVALFLTLATLVFPKTPAAWALGVFLALFSLGAFGAAPSWKFFVVLAGAHLLHIIGMTLAWLPIGGPVQLRVIGRLLRPFLIIQVPAQLVSLVVLNILSGKTMVAALISPAFGIVAAVGFVLLVLFVVLPMLRGDE